MSSRRFGTYIVLLGALAPGAAIASGNRVEFDRALIKGQANTGAVHLMERKEAELGSLVKHRHHYRDRIMESLGEEGESGLQRIDAQEQHGDSERAAESR